MCNEMLNSIDVWYEALAASGNCHVGRHPT